MVSLLDRGAEDGEDAVAGVADERAAVVEDCADDLLEMQLIRSSTCCGREVLRGGREPAQVGEEHGALDCDAAEPEVAVRPLQHLGDDRLRDEAREDVRTCSRSKRSSRSVTPSEPTVESASAVSG